MSESTQHIPDRLRYHIHILGDLLGETIADQHGGQMVDRLEEIRNLSKSRRQTDPHLKSRLLEALKGLSEHELISVTRAFNQFLQLANIAEQVQTIAAEDTSTTSGSLLGETFKTLRDANRTPAEIAGAINNLNCDLVLTAHPTQITRRTLIRKYDHIANLLQTLDIETRDKERPLVQLKRLIAETWHTDEIHIERPTPQEEAIWGYAIIENSFWHAVPQIWRDLDDLLFENTKNNLPITFSPVKLSTWMGGDRYNSPQVSTDVTREVLRLARWMAADLYLRDIEQLLARLSMSECNRELRNLVGDSAQEPYRHVLRNLRDKLQNTRLWAEEKPAGNNLIRRNEDLFIPLHACYRSLHECGMGIIAEGELKDTLVRLACFGVTLVNLDIRQSSEKHERLLDDLTRHLNLGSYSDWSETKRQHFLISELESKRPLIPETWQPSEECREVLATFRLIAHTNAAGIGSYVVSLAQQPSDILEVILILRKTGLQQALPVVPLFETLNDLEQAEDTLLQLFKIRWYKKHIADKQQVMIDYSESAKDAGHMAAAWAQYRAQDAMAEICNKYKVKLILFHGRDGAMGRTHGTAQNSRLAHPPGSIRNGVRLMEQGETMQFKYGSPDVALVNLGRLLSNAIEAMLLPTTPPRATWQHVMDDLSEQANRDYDDIIQNGDDFLAYLDQGSPLQELAELALGNPQKNSPAASLQSKSIHSVNAVQWIFAWTQKRLMLHAWLGTSYALQSYASPEKLAVLQEMLQEWPFFKTQIDILEQMLAMADLEISNDYDALLVSPSLHHIADHFSSELENLIELINRLKMQDKLLTSMPEITASLAVRNTYTDPLHFLQMELISRRRTEGGNTSDVIIKALLVTIAGIAAGTHSIS